MIPEQISNDIENLNEKFDVVEVYEGNPIIIVINNYQLPLGFKLKSTQLLLKIPVAFPNGKPDMFWVELGAVPKNGKLPFNPITENILEKNWLRYSWHLQKWNPVSDNLLTFIEFVDQGLKKAGR